MRALGEGEKTASPSGWELKSDNDARRENMAAHASSHLTQELDVSAIKKLNPAPKSQAGHSPVPRKHLEEDLCTHIFSASVTMIGICLTVIGLVRIVITLRGIDTVADDLLALDALLFLLAGVAAYAALRRRTLVRMHRVEQIADLAFLLGMVLMVLVCLILTYAVTTQ